MKQSIKLKTTTLLFIPLVLACFALLPRAQAAEQPALLPAPPPDGAYAGFNTAEGFQALINVNTATGIFNTAIGAKTLSADTTGAHNTAVGAQALLHNNGSYNTAVGENALVFNTTGSQNMALGQGALANNLAGSSNTAMGFQALTRNNTDDNTAIGFQALFSNTTGLLNTAVGYRALFSNIGPSGSGLDGSDSVAVGFGALFSNTTGHDNTAVGLAALRNNITGFLNAALGSVAGSRTTGNNNIDIANEGVAGESNTIRIGTQAPATDIFGVILPKHTAIYIAGISGVTIATNSAPVAIDTVSGQLGIQAASSQRFKDEIKPMDKASEAILALKPITFHYKKEIDAKRTPQFGLVAEQVEKVNPALVTRDADGKPYTVRYEAVNAMLLNEFLKEHKTVQEQKATIAQLKHDFESKLAQQQKQIEALTTGLQKVSDQLELSKSAPRTVLNNQ
jgi:Chaperone of endosialidase